VAARQQDEPPGAPRSATGALPQGSPATPHDDERAVAQALGEVATALAAGDGRDTVLRRIADLVRRLAAADLVAVAVSDGSVSDPRVVATSGHGGAALEDRIFHAADPDPVGRALATGERAILVEAATGAGQHPPGATGLETARAAVAVPLRSGDRPLGLLLACRRTADPFRPADLLTIDLFARHAALAVRCAALQDGQDPAGGLRVSQERLVRAERLSALGEMASGVAHDFNNLLAVILGRAQLLMLRTDDPQARRGLGVIEAAATEAAQTIRRIHEFTRTRQSRAYVPVSLADVVAQSVELTRGRWKGEAQIDGVAYTITTDVAAGIRVSGDPVELRELFANLLLNAFDAMADGGHVALVARVAGGYVSVDVRDTGPGMTHEVRTRVFEPFFTTKGPRRTGLGLSVAYGITQRHRGSIEVDSREGRGTTFTVALPLIETAEGPGPEADRGPHRRGPSARVLVIEDEPMVGEVLLDLLRSAGHAPLWATEGAAALALMESAPPDIALVDLGLPGMSGLEVAGRMKAAHPEMPIVLVTGWADRVDPEAVRRTGISQVVAKPFRAEEILRIVAAAVKAPPAGRASTE
jgi:signal transduction histidine kinase/CheY-like chemotaxis protein